MRFRYSAGENGKLVKKAVIYTRDEHRINFADVDADAVSIVKKLKDAGFDTYIVGGAVRDLILGKKPKDFDIASAASPARIKRLFPSSRIIGRRFRLVHVYSGRRIFEVSTFRSLRDGITSNTFGSIEDDVLRRDFTMNALFYDPDQQIVVDYVGGMKDIQKKQVKPVISLAEIFADDPVRMIRAVKYAAAAGFSLPVSLRWKIRKQSSLIALISPSRLTEEIFKIIHSDKASIIVDALDNMGLYIYLQPKAAKLMKESPGFRRRYLRSAAALNREGETPKHEALGALFNDYLQDIADWERGIAENYRLLYQAARAFIAPMNPPGFEMDRAVRNFFAAHGVTVKKSHFLEKPKPAHEPADAPEAAKKRQRRRRRGKKPSPPVQDGQE